MFIYNSYSFSYAVIRVQVYLLCLDSTFLAITLFAIVQLGRGQKLRQLIVCLMLSLPLLRILEALAKLHLLKNPIIKCAISIILLHPAHFLLRNNIFLFRNNLY